MSRWLTLACLLAALPAFGSGLYPIRVGPDHRHVVDQHGAPFLIHGDSAWSLITALTKEDAAKYLDNRRRKGFNSIIVNLIEHKFNGPINRYGEGPFAATGDFSTPNEKYFEHADWVIRKAGEMGIQVFLAPIYLGYPGLDEGWYDEALRNGPAKCREWGRYVGRRYAGFDNIVWLMGGDRNPGAAMEDANAVARGIREFGTRHLFTAHCHPENSAVEQYGKTGWLDLNDTYSYEIIHHRLIADYNHTPAMPYFLIETTYEGEHNASAVQIRRQAWWAVLFGAAGQFMGNRPIWLFDPGWVEAMDATGSRDMARLKQFFTAQRWNELVQDLKHEAVVDGLGEFNGLDYLAAARTSDGSTLIAYLPSSRTVTVEMTTISGRVANASWFNPRDGSTVAIGSFATKGRRRFTPPAEGDWVLVLHGPAGH